MSVSLTKHLLLVTVLAFFFIPISLGTSIFGMNIAELNETGQPLWVFLATTVAIFALSSLTWGFFYQLHKYNSLPNYIDKRTDRFSSLPPENWVSSRVRLHQFLRLIWHGHLLWIWKSGIALSLLTRGRKGFLKSCSEHDDKGLVNLGDMSEATQYLEKHELPRSCYVHSPCAYIIIHLYLQCGFDSSKLEPAI